MANEETWKPAKSDKSERLFQLTCVLLYSERGLTKREYFAAMAMQGMLSAHNPVFTKISDIAQGAYAMADAMLEARE